MICCHVVSIFNWFSEFVNFDIFLSYMISLLMLDVRLAFLFNVSRYLFYAIYHVSSTCVLLLHLWNNRNDRIFEEGYSSFDSFSALVHNMTSWWCINNTKFFCNYSLLMLLNNWRSHLVWFRGFSLPPPLSCCFFFFFFCWFIQLYIYVYIHAICHISSSQFWTFSSLMNLCFCCTTCFIVKE